MVLYNQDRHLTRLVFMPVNFVKAQNYEEARSLYTLLSRDKDFAIVIPSEGVVYCYPAEKWDLYRVYHRVLLTLGVARYYQYDAGDCSLIESN